MLSQFVSASIEAHHATSIHFLQYIKNSREKGLYFAPSSNLKLSAFSDSDWACCPDSRQSITSYTVFIGPYSIYWKSRNQQFHALVHWAVWLLGLPLDLQAEFYLDHCGMPRYRFS